MNNSRYTDDELYVCRNTDLVCVCETLGYHVKKGPTYCMVKEMDSLMIKNRKTFVRYSNNTHGTAIDFLMDVQNMSWSEAVEWLLDYNGMSRTNKNTIVRPHGLWFDVRRKEDGFEISPVEKTKALHQAPEESETEKIPFELPEKTEPVRLRKYLVNERKLSEAVVDIALEKGLIYEDSKHHNVIFVGMDADGNPKHASVRGTYTPTGSKPYKGTVPGSDTAFSFNIVDENSNHLAVFEAPIDAMSYMDLKQESESFSGNYLALTGVHDRALEQFLSDHPNIKQIILCLDMDEAGENGCKRIMEKYSDGEYKDRGLTFVREKVPEGCKDWNEYLSGIYVKKQSNGGIAI